MTTDYYFDGTSGSDSNDGLTELTPCLTIKPATIGGAFNPTNVRFFIKRGTTVYLDVSAIHPQGPFYIGPYGDGTEKPTIIYNANGDYYIATGTGAVAGDEIVFDSVIIQDATTTALTSAVYQNDSGSGTIIVKDCELTGFAFGIQTQRGNGHQILRNRITQWRNSGIIIEHASVAAPSNMLIANNYVDSNGPTGTASNDAIVLHNGTSNGYGNIIRDNICVAGLEQAIDVLAMFPGTVIERNITYPPPNSTTTLWCEVFCRGANSIIRNNLIFTKNRGAIQLDAAGITVDCNTFVGTDGYAAGPYVYVFATATGVKIRNNHFVMKSSYAASAILVATGVTNGTSINNVFVNYSASTACRFLAAVTFGNLATWTIDNNYYGQMSGSYATPWAGARTYAAWILTAGTPDSGTGVVTTTNPLKIPEYNNSGQDFDLTKLYKINSDSPLLELGAHSQYRNAVNGVQFWNPPTIGPAEYVRPKTDRA